MNKALARRESAVAKAAGELARLHEQTSAAREMLNRLQWEVTDAKERLAGSEAGNLVEANEHLVQAMIRGQVEAEAAASALREVSRWAERDALTKLPNRVLLLDRFARAIASARRRGNRLALLFVDLDNFKHINDAFGHAFGDEVLKLAAQCMELSVREVDTVSRHGGDEFLILLGEVSLASDAVTIARKVQTAMAAHSRVGEHLVDLKASIGISIFPDDGDDANKLIERADTAMYRAKRQGTGICLFHEPLTESEAGTQAVVYTPNSAVAHYEKALMRHEHHHSLLRETNGQLVLAALGAQEKHAVATQGQRRQMESLAVVAHELRNPLTPILTAASLLGFAHADKTLLPKARAIIERQVGHISRLVGDLLDVSRINTGKFRLQREVIEIADVINAAVDACRPAMDDRAQDFSVHLPAHALNVDGDPVRLTQVLSNLLDNASKYTPDRGHIRLSAALSEDVIVITVTDGGIGISAEALPNVFEPFVQDDHAVGFNNAGLGIGLAVVRELVEAHGGTVVAHSDGAGLGSRFVVTLPFFKVLVVDPQ